MIETLTLRNFKVLREVEVKLRPLTLIVGPNASGKSTILEALKFLVDCSQRSEVRKGRATRVDGLQQLLSRRTEGAFEAGFDSRIDEVPSRLFIQSPIPLPHKTVIPTVNFTGEGRAASAIVLEFDVQKLAAPSPMKGAGLLLPEDGSDLSSVLAGFHLEQPVQFRQIVDRLQRVVPHVKDVRFKRTHLASGEIGYELVFDTTSAENVPAHSVSSGTLITLGLLTVLSSPEPPQLVLIDDLERGLHPKALGELIRQFRILQEQNPELQIIATSHSPYLLDCVEAEEVLLTSLDQDGYAVVKSLTEHPEYERWKDLMAPGEFWSTVGESWVTEPQAAK